MGKKRRSQPRQLTFEDTAAGRKHPGGRPKSKDSGVSHLKREVVSKNVPILVTTDVVDGLPSLRTRDSYEVFWSAFEQGSERPGRGDGEFRVTEYSIQGNHLHLLVEASDNDSLARGMQGLKIRIAKGLNKLWGRTGKVWSDRFHARLLRTPKEVRNALRYLLDNARKHGRRWLRKGEKNRPDPFSSGMWFDGWANYVHDGFVALGAPVAQARSWLARVGWRKHGLLVLPRE
jgi:REP element-mobilizing transposase RayT